MRQIAFAAAALLLPLATVAGAILPGAARADGVAGSAALVSDYTFRGVSQTDESPALQIGVEYTTEAFGVMPYASIWGSNVDFHSDNSLEVDLAVGIRADLGGPTIDLGYIYYFYPGAPSARNYNFYELGAKLGYDFGIATANLGINWSPEFFGHSGGAFYYQVNAEAPLPFFGLTLSAHGGRQIIEKNAVAGLPDYFDWSLGISKEVFGFVLGLAYVDTDIKKSECGGGTKLCDPRAVASLTVKF